MLLEYISNNNMTLYSNGKTTEEIESMGLTSQIKDELVIAPNPSQGVFTLSSSGEINKIDVFDSSGRKMYSKSFDTAQKRMDLELNQLTAGSYYIKIRSVDGNIQTKKIAIIN